MKQRETPREALEQQLDNAYRERAHLVALLAAMTSGAVIVPAPDIDDEDSWQIAHLNIGGRQASWHISPRDADLLEAVEHVPADDPRARWDGHSTEDKYARIRQHTRLLYRACGPECAEMHQGGHRCRPNRPGSEGGSSIADCAADDRRRLLEKEGE
ncbi:hypothetical protein CG723_41400 [Streptomyces sp. CB01635]|uniref:hypothetical protein n=1 Tax=unclassified Streptomyces TaxID=2593676 RepID=UPI000C2718D2|nr:hypothetical protein [Streptomyces sp. CB01635]PJN06057.1 hypothetical protein CG723_41400 [Streptomyces sp. CB01635]